MVMIYAGGHISGGHYNPAVTLAVLVRRRIGLRDAVAYWIVQFGAGLLAAVVVRGIIDPALMASTARMTLSRHTLVAAFVVELLFAFALCYVVLNVATSKSHPDNPYYGLAAVHRGCGRGRGRRDLWWCVQPRRLVRRCRDEHVRLADAVGVPGGADSRRARRRSHVPRTQPGRQMIADTMHPDIPVVPQRTPTGTLTTAPPSIERRPCSLQDPMGARSTLGLANFPTIVAIGPFDDLVHVHHLAAAFTVVQRFCRSQLVLLGAGARRAVRAVPRSAETRVHMFDHASEQLWSEVVAAADLVAMSTVSGSTTLLDVLAAGRAVVTPDDPATVRLVVPSSAGLVYRPGDIIRDGCQRFHGS